jgi:hypothetical protein
MSSRRWLGVYERGDRGSLEGRSPAAGRDGRSVLAGPDDRSVLAGPDDRSVLAGPDGRSLLAGPDGQALLADLDGVGADGASGSPHPAHREAPAFAIWEHCGHCMADRGRPRQTRTRGIAARASSMSSTW